MWKRYLAAPVPGTYSIAVDRPGFGRSTWGSALPSFADQAEAIAALLPHPDAPQHTKPILVGHSLGGPIVARIAADYPERISGIVIVAGSLDPDLEKPRWYNHIGHSIRALLPSAMRHSNDELFAAVAETRALAELMSLVSSPVVIIHGTNDSLVPYANVEYMQRSLTNAQTIDTVTLHGAGHLIPWRNEQPLRQAIARLIPTRSGLPTNSN